MRENDGFPDPMIHATSPALALEQISCTFISGDDPGQRYTAVGDTSLIVAGGEFVSVVGPTGCGKSTLLNVAAGLLQPSSGSVKVFDEPLTGINTRAGYMFQAEALMPWRNTIENVIAGLQFRHMEREAALARGNEWLKRVGLSGFGTRYPHQLSGGMRKRVALAQMLILDPQKLGQDHHAVPAGSGQIQPRGDPDDQILVPRFGKVNEPRVHVGCVARHLRHLDSAPQSHSDQDRAHEKDG